MEEPVRIRVGSGGNGAGYWLSEVTAPGEQGHYSLRLEQQIGLPSDAIEVILELASQFRAMRKRCRGEWEYTSLTAISEKDKLISARFYPGNSPVEKVCEVRLAISGRMMTMAISTLLRLADTLARFCEQGKLEIIWPPFKPEEGKS